jgi:antitoxin YefM
MAIVNQSEFRANMAKLMDQVDDDSKELIITRTGGKKHMVMITLDEYESWKETEYLLSSPANAAMLRESMEQLRNGQKIEVEFDEDGHLVPVAELLANKQKAA